MSAFDPSHSGRLIKREDGRWVLRDDLRAAPDAHHHLLDATDATSKHFDLGNHSYPKSQRPGETRLQATKRGYDELLSADPSAKDELLEHLESKLHEQRQRADMKVADGWSPSKAAADEAFERQAVDPDGKSPKQLRGKHVWMYHGTTDAFLPNIESRGINHLAPHWSNVGRTATSRPTPGHVYLTSDADQARRYANGASAKHGGSGTVLRVAVPFDELSRDADDADLASGRTQWRLSRTVTPDEIKEINGQRRESHKGLHAVNAPVILEPPPAPNRAKHPFVATIRFAGLPLINVENKKGGERSGTDPDGNPWSVTMPAHYGEFDDTLGVDGDPIDVYVGGNRHAPYAYLVPVARLDDGGYDEDKVFVGFNNLDEVCTAFRAAYNKRGFRFDVTRRMTIPALAEWLRDHGQKGRRIRLGVELHKTPSPGLYLTHLDGTITHIRDWLADRATAVDDCPPRAQLRFITEEECREMARRDSGGMRPFTFDELAALAEGEPDDDDLDDLIDMRIGTNEVHKGFRWAREALKALQTTMFGVSPNLQTVTKTDKNGRTERRHVKTVDPRKVDPRTIDLEDAIRAKQEAARPKPPPPPHPDPMIRQIQAEESERGKPKPAPEPETYSGPDTATIGLPGITDPGHPSIGGKLPTPANKFASMINMLTTQQKAETAARRASPPRTFSLHRHLGGSAA